MLLTYFFASHFMVTKYSLSISLPVSLYFFFITLVTPQLSGKKKLIGTVSGSTWCVILFFILYILLVMSFNNLKLTPSGLWPMTSQLGNQSCTWITRIWFFPLFEGSDILILKTGRTSLPLKFIFMFQWKVTRGKDQWRLQESKKTRN